MNLKTNKNKTNRMINNGNYIKRGTRSTTRDLSKIHYSPLRTTERAFNSLPRKLRNMTGVKVDTFKKHLDCWMLQVPDLPKCKGYQKAPLTVALEHRAPCYFFHQVTKIANCHAKLATYIYNVYIYLL